MVKDLKTFSRLVLLAFFSLMLFVSCATQQKPMMQSHLVNVTVDARMQNVSADVDPMYEWINNIRSSENVIIIYDASGSMLWPSKDGGEARYVSSIAQFEQYIRDFKPEDNVGLIVFGSQYVSGIYAGKINNMSAAKKSCNEDIKIVVPFSKFNKTAFDAEILRLSDKKSYKGDTPIGNAILNAVELLQNKPGERKKIIVITDGVEECYNQKEPSKSVPGSISPESAYKKAKDNNITVKIIAVAIGKDKKGEMIVPNLDELLNSFKQFSDEVYHASSGEQLLEQLKNERIADFKFHLLDSKGKLVSRFSARQPIQFDIAPYINAAQQEQQSKSGFVDKLAAMIDKSKDSSSNQKVKFTLSIPLTKGNISKDIAIPVEEKDIKLFLGLSSPTDMNPDIEPQKYLWK